MAYLKHIQVSHHLHSHSSKNLFRANRGESFKIYVFAVLKLIISGVSAVKMNK